MDAAGFTEAMEKQKAMARKAWSGSGDKGIATTYLNLADKVGASEFLGYETTTANGMIVGLIADEKEVENIKANTEAVLVANQTPFYAESGGQLGDSGTIYDDTTNKPIAEVSDTWKTPSGVFFHVIKTLAPLKLGQGCRFEVDATRRQYLRANHSATHLLQEALREILGTHVMQKGSQVAPTRLRFDFSHTKAVSTDELTAIEALVNQRLLQNTAVTTRIMTPDAAMQEGALALFGEKYGEEVRVVSMGGASDIDGRTAWSVELCGGTHVARTGEIGLFKIIGESAVSSGVRRIEAVTNMGAMAWVRDHLAMLGESANALKTTPEQLPKRLNAMLEERRQSEQTIADLRHKLASGGGGDTDISRDLDGIGFLGRVLTDTPAASLKSIAEGMMQADGVVALVAVNDGKASLVVAVSDSLTPKINAVDLVRVGAEILGGKGGGGRPDMAQAGGPDAGKAEAAIEGIIKTLT